MQMVDYVKLAIRRWNDFQGRSRRAEYWWFVLAMFITGIVAAILDGLLFGNFENGPLQVLLALASILPSVALAIRRLHDIGRSGWWLLIALVPIVGVLVLLFFNVQPGTVGENRFGPDPLDGTAAAPDPLVN